MKLFILFSLAFLSVHVFAPKDEFKTKKGALVVHPVWHSSMVLQWDGKTIYVDPSGNAEMYQSFPAPDLILITHIHSDHFDEAILNLMKTGKADFIVPPAVKEKVENIPSKAIIVMKNGEQQSWNNIKIEATAMYNLPEDNPRAFHKKGRGNGYILELGGVRVYISGDTEDIPEMRAMKNIDVAFVCMNLPYTMDIYKAADAVLEFKPKVVFPFHYKNGDGTLGDVAKFKEIVQSKNPAIDVRLREWYAE